MHPREFAREVSKRKTFAIISHPDAGKTTITEKMLFFGKVINNIKSIKGRGSSQYSKSDWMEIEKKRGISITTSVMQFPYRNCLINLLDTPGHEDFSEDTYRTLSAADCCLMVIDAAKGVEARTNKLMEVARLRETPILTFMNKLDREILDPIELMDEVERKLSIACAPITWPIGCGKLFKGVYHLYRDETYLYRSSTGYATPQVHLIKGLRNPELNALLGNDLVQQLYNELELIQGASHRFIQKTFLGATLTPVFFGTAWGNFGVDHILDALVEWAPSPMPRRTNTREVSAYEDSFSGFIFKIQANMDPKHRDRVAFMRIVSGFYKKGIKLYQVRTGRVVSISDALTFIADDRSEVKVACPGDIIGIHSHGTIQIGDTFTQGEKMHFAGIPNFAPELFRRINLRDPLKQKHLLKGLVQLAEEGAVQVFRPISNNDLIVGAVGVLQLDVVVERLQREYGVEVLYQLVNISTVRWVSCSNIQIFKEFKRKNELHLAMDSSNNLVYIAPTWANLHLIKERYLEVAFRKVSE